MTLKVLATITVVAGTLLAQGPYGAGGPRRSGGMGGRASLGGDAAELKAALGLTDTQVQQMRDLRKQQAEAAKPAMDQMRAKRQALAEAMRSANPDSAQIGQMMVDIRKLGDSMKGARDERESKALAMLTPEQKTKLTALQEAQKLMPAVRQATALGLLEPPQGEGAERMKGAMAQRGAGRGGRGPRL